jgi:hypothetical protein
MRTFGYRHLWIVIIWLLSSQAVCRAQTFTIGNARTLKKTAFDPATKNMYAIWRDSIRVFYPPEYSSTKLISIVPPNLHYPEVFTAICADSKLYFVRSSGGEVYELQEDSIVRIDRSFDHRMQINATIFSRNDTLMLYGGYGFWSDRNFFTYFSEQSREWEILPPSGSKQLPRGGRLTQLVQNGAHIYIFSGRSTNDINPLEVDDFREVWRFDLHSKSWEHLGDLTEDYHKYNKVLHMGDKTLLGAPDKYQWVLVDPAKNELAFYEINALKKGVYFRAPNTNFDIRSFYDSGKFYVVRAKEAIPSGTWDGELVCTILDEEDFLGAPLYTERMYAPNGFPMEFAGGALAAIGVVLLAFYGRRRYKEKDKLLVSDKSVRHKGKKVAMDPTSLKVLNLLLRTDGDVQSQLILDMVENPQLSPAHNIRVKNQVIENLNFQLKTLLATEEDPIQSKKSEEDKRIKSYTVQSRHFSIR